MERINLRRRPAAKKEDKPKRSRAVRAPRAVQYVHAKSGTVATFVKRVSVPDGNGGRCECIMCLADGGPSLSSYYMIYPVSHWTTLKGQKVE